MIDSKILELVPYFKMLSVCFYQSFIFFPQRFYLFIFREGGREGEREGEKHQCVVPLVRSLPGPGQQPRHVPWLGTEPATPWFTGWHSIHWATPATVFLSKFYMYIVYGTTTLYNLLGKKQFFDCLPDPNTHTHTLSVPQKLPLWNHLIDIFGSYFHIS